MNILEKLGLTKEQIDLLKNVSFADVHKAAIKRGAINVLDLFDSLPAFKPTESWASWRAFLAALYALPMSPSEQALYRACTGRERLPDAPAREAHVIVGRRGGKDRVASALAAFVAACKDYSPYLAPGQRGFLPVIAADRKQAREIMAYLDGLFSMPAFKPMVQSQTSEQIRLNNNVTIEIFTSSYRTARGYTLVSAICNEIAFWRNEQSKNPDEEIIKAIRPGMASIPGAVLFCCSSPYARKGVLWEAYQKHYGKDGDVLVWKASTTTMHPGNKQVEQEVARAYRDDPISAAAEYGAEFRKDVEAFVPMEVVDAAIKQGVFERPPEPGVTYCAFTDVSGGTSDSFTLAITHYEQGRVVLDAIREWTAPFEPDACVEEAAALLKSYGLRLVWGDRYGGEWPRERFRSHGIQYAPADNPKSHIYRDFLPLLSSGQVDLLDHPKCRTQLLGLDRRVSRGGHESIDHDPGGHDDVANAVAGACVWAATQRRERKDVPVVYESTAELRRAMLREQMNPNRKKRPVIDPYAR